MAEPKKKMSKARTGMRRAHDALRAPNLSVCPQCGAAKRSHRVCAECGHYKGLQVFEVEKEDEV